MERAAERFLRRQGLTVEARNWRCPAGELDLIMRDGFLRVFVEVRYRVDEKHGGGIASIGPRKRRRLLRTALVYLRRRGALDTPCRFDVVAVTGVNSRLEFRWIRSAFDASDFP